MTCFWIVPAIPDLQAAWLLLSYCASARANFVLRIVRPELAGEFCVLHDAAIRKCHTTILGVQASAIPELTHRTVSLPFTRGGLGLQSASRTHIAAYWASWVDGLAMVQKRHPDVAHLIIGEMHQDTRSESIRGMVECEGNSAERDSSHEVPTHSIQRVMKTAQHHGPGGNDPQPPDSMRIAFPRCGPRSATPRKR